MDAMRADKRIGKGEKQRMSPSESKQYNHDSIHNRHFESSFTKQAHCAACKDAQIEFTVSPTAWPIQTVGQCCYQCGRILRYVDNLLLFSEREAVLEYTTRLGGVVDHGAAKPVDNYVDRETILRCLEIGLPIEAIAAELHCKQQYVKQIARAAGLSR